MTPKLRFPAFSSDWQSARLGDFFTFKNGVNADKSMYGSGRKFINVMDVMAKAPITHDTIIGSVQISDKEFAKNEVLYGDVLFQRSSETREEVGQSNIYVDQRPATFGGFVIRGRPKQSINPYYFDALLKTDAVRKDMTSRSGGSTRYNIGQESLDAVAVCIAPSLPEQQKIADFFGTVDERITLLTRKAEALKRHKREVARRLFTRELRFLRDDGTAFPDWTPTHLGRLGKFYGGGTPDTTVGAYWQGSIPWVSSSDLYDNEIHRLDLTRHITDSAVKSSATMIIPKGAILIVTRVGIGKVAIAPDAVCTSQDFSNLLLIRDDAKFLAYWLTHHKNRLLGLAQGTSIKGLTTVDLKLLKIDLPHVDEQRRIAEFLSALDIKIDAVRAKIAAMQTFKRGLLQQMFV